MVDGTRPELDRERDRTGFRELVAVQAQCEPRIRAGIEVATRLLGVERAALDEHVGGFGDPRRVREHLSQRELEIRVGVGELRWDGVSAEPRRYAPGRTDRPQ